MLATINTDASYSKLTKQATFAFWIKTDKYTIKRSGVIKSLCDTSTEAELKCIINAIYTISEQTGITEIILNTDSLNSIHILTKDIKNIRKYSLHWGDKYLKMAESIIKNIKIDYRHVKAHNDTDSSRTYVNDWCDKAAKEEMGKILKLIKN